MRFGSAAPTVGRFLARIGIGENCRSELVHLGRRALSDHFRKAGLPRNSAGYMSLWWLMGSQEDRGDGRNVLHGRSPT